MSHGVATGTVYNYFTGKEEILPALTEEYWERTLAEMGEAETEAQLRMAALLGAGDAFRLVPRAYALWTTGLAANAAALGFGKLVTSVTMTVFYLILYYIWRDRYRIQGRKGLTAAMRGLALSFGFYLPVALLSGVALMVGMLMIPKTLAYVWIVCVGWRLYRESRKTKEH